MPLVLLYGLAGSLVNILLDGQTETRNEREKTTQSAFPLTKPCSWPLLSRYGQRSAAIQINYE